MPKAGRVVTAKLALNSRGKKGRIVEFIYRCFDITPSLPYIDDKSIK